MVVVNDNFERAYMDFLKAIRPELDEFQKQQATNPSKCCANGGDLTMPKTAPIVEDGIGVDANWGIWSWWSFRKWAKFFDCCDFGSS